MRGEHNTAQAMPRPAGPAMRLASIARAQSWPRRLLASLVLLLMVWSFTGFVLAEQLSHSDDSLASIGTLHHSLPCSDGHDEGPLDSDCNCDSCPHHVHAVFNDPPRCASHVLLDAPRPALRHDDALGKYQHQRLLRPPRA